MLLWLCKFKQFNLRFTTFFLTIFVVFALSFPVSAQKPFVFRDGNNIETFQASDLKGFVFNGLLQNIKQLNAQLPIQIDELTEMYSAILNGTAINYNYKVYIDSTLLTDAEIKDLYDELKGVQKENLRFLFKKNADKMPVSEWVRLYKALGIKYHYNYIDANQRAFLKIVLDLSDF